MASSAFTAFNRLFTTFSGTSRMASSSELGTGAAAPAASIPAGAQQATIAAGCFWGVEHAYRKQYPTGLYDARVGYVGGDTANPSYRAVCTGATGHAEATRIVFDPKVISYRQLIEFFYRMHDPTTKNQQGMDTGTQYRSAIFYHDAEQEAIARDVTERASKQWWHGQVVTELLPIQKWWDAEDYHQAYLFKNPSGYQCASHYVRKFPELT